MDEEYERLLFELKRANPADREQFADWVKDKGDRFLDERVLAHRVTQPRPRRVMRRWALAAGALVVLVVAVVVPLAVLRYSTSQERPAQVTNASTSVSTEQSVEHVLRGTTLGRILSLAELDQTTDSRPTYRPSDGHDDRQLVDEAVARGILLASEGPDYQLNEPVTRGQFALWLWRAFGPRLPLGEPVDINDPGDVPQEEWEAIIGLVRAGIFAVYPDGSFRSTTPLSPEEERSALVLIEELIEP